MSVKLILKDVRGSYVFLKQPRPSEDGTGKYSMQIIIDKNDPQVQQIKAAIAQVARETFGEKVKLGAIKIPLRDGDEERDGKEYENKYFFNANSGRAPQIVNRFGKTASDEDIEEYCYSGATFHVSLSFYTFDRAGKKGVAVGLQNVMLRKKTERLDGGVSATDEFATMADKDEEDPFAPANTADTEDIDF